jgi:hypothetical protein
MPFFNAAGTLPRAVLSLRHIAADFRPSVHLLGIDDGSSDCSAEVFRQSVVEVHGLRWTLLHRENGGSGAARNEALKAFLQGWTLLLDADDELITDPSLFLKEGAGRSALLFATEYVREGKPLFRLPACRPDSSRLQEVFSRGNPCCTLSLIFRRELLDTLFAEDLLFLEDWHFFACNPRVFTDSSIHAQALGRVHGARSGKSADQCKNGYYRSLVARRLIALWQAMPGSVVFNNLALQQTIGKLQMQQKVTWGDALSFPVSATLFMKFLVYRFAYRLYLRIYPYA